MARAGASAQPKSKNRPNSRASKVRKGRLITAIFGKQKIGQGVKSSSIYATGAVIAVLLTVLSPSANQHQMLARTIATFSLSTLGFVSSRFGD